MKESEALAKVCLEHYAITYPAVLEAIRLGVMTRPEKEKALKEGILCLGSICMKWESEYKEESRFISEDSPTPDGWSPIQVLTVDKDPSSNTREIRRRVKSDFGDCGLKHKQGD